MTRCVHMRVTELVEFAFAMDAVVVESGPTGLDVGICRGSLGRDSGIIVRALAVVAVAGRLANGYLGFFRGRK